MVRRLFVLAFVLVSAALTWSAPTYARTVNLPSGNPVMSVDIPADWKTRPTSRGIEVRSPDEEVFFWIEIYLPSEYATVVQEHERYFEKQGVKITGAARTASNNAGGATIKASDFPATWKGKPTVLRYLAIDPNLPAKNQVLLSYWASPEGDRTYDAAFKTILDSLGAPK